MNVKDKPIGLHPVKYTSFPVYSISCQIYHASGLLDTVNLREERQVLNTNHVTNVTNNGLACFDSND